MAIAGAVLAAGTFGGVGFAASNGRDSTRTNISSHNPADAARLHALADKQEPMRAVDRLLIAALIEARSCERFGLLRDHLSDAELAAFFGGLFESEARHHSSTRVSAATHASSKTRSHTHCSSPPSNTGVINSAYSR